MRRYFAKAFTAIAKRIFHIVRGEENGNECEYELPISRSTNEKRLWLYRRFLNSLLRTLSTNEQISVLS